MELGRVYVDAVTVPNGKRPIDDRKVAGLAESLSALGLQQPISVWSPNDETVVLVAGRHRFAAAQKLGWEEIDCIFVQMDEIDRELWEIDENLLRNELTPAEIAEHMARRKALWEQRREVSGKVSPKPSGGRPKGFASETAEAVGRDKKTITQAITRGEKIAPDVLESVKDKPDLNKGVVLDQLAKMTPDEQRAVVAAGRRPVQPPPEAPDSDLEPTNKIRRRLASAWNAAPPVDREWFREWIDRKPIFDRTPSGRAA